MTYQDVATQTERVPAQFIKIESFHKLRFNRYYFDPETESIFTIRDGKNGEIRKQIKATNSGGKRIAVLRDVDDKPRTINYTNLIEFCKSL